MGEIKKKTKSQIQTMTKMNFNKHKCCKKSKHQEITIDNINNFQANKTSQHINNHNVLNKSTI